MLAPVNYFLGNYWQTIKCLLVGVPLLIWSWICIGGEDDE